MNEGSICSFFLAQFVLTSAELNKLWIVQETLAVTNISESFCKDFAGNLVLRSGEQLIDVKCFLNLLSLCMDSEYLHIFGQTKAKG